MGDSAAPANSTRGRVNRGHLQLAIFAVVATLVFVYGFGRVEKAYSMFSADWVHASQHADARINELTCPVKNCGGQRYPMEFWVDKQVQPPSLLAFAEANELILSAYAAVGLLASWLIAVLAVRLIPDRRATR